MVAGIHRLFEGLHQLALEPEYVMATRDGSDPTLKFHRIDSPRAAPIGIQLRKPRGGKSRQFERFSAFNQTWNVVGSFSSRIV